MKLNLKILDLILFIIATNYKLEFHCWLTRKNSVKNTSEYEGKEQQFSYNICITSKKDLV